MCLEKHFLIYLAAIFLTAVGVSGVFPLVTSLNIEEAAVTASIAIGYALSIISTLIAPSIEVVFGVKTLIVAAPVLFLMFVLGNIYAASYTLIPAGLFNGIAEGWFWGVGTYVATNFAILASRSDSSNYSERRSRYIGFFFAAAQSAVIASSGISFLFLFVDKTLSGKGNFTRNQDFSFCGANDCQDPNITLANIDQYTPAYPATRYSLIGFLALLEVIAIVLQVVYLPKNINQCMNQLESPIPEGGDRRQSDIIEPCRTLEGASLESQSPSDLQQPASSDQAQKKDPLNPLHVLKTSLKCTFELLLKPKHLLVMLLPIYDGLLIGFFYAEVTRGFVSCALGVDKVGIATILFGGSDALTSCLVGKFAGKYGRNIPYIFAFFVDIGNYTACLHWKITEENSWAIYILSFSFGLTDGVWQTLSNEMYGSYFEKDAKYAYVLWTLMVQLGLLIQFSISKALCVWQKIYLQMAVLSVGFFLYGISWNFYVWRRRQLKTKDCDVVVVTATGEKD
ncbi:unnamed protein product [Clavelina lepadiformis]|uniref:Protein unc-93 homolog A n=1 Tax=Clavelina lepadiformis TaxID=159417 RepID=A0ABP0FNX7_CLALP